jgi:hypothetical protein
VACREAKSSLLLIIVAEAHVPSNQEFAGGPSMCRRGDLRRADRTRHTSQVTAATKVVSKSLMPPIGCRSRRGQSQCSIEGRTSSDSTVIHDGRMTHSDGRPWHDDLQWAKSPCNSEIDPSPGDYKLFGPPRRPPSRSERNSVLPAIATHKNVLNSSWESYGQCWGSQGLTLDRQSMTHGQILGQ